MPEAPDYEPPSTSAPVVDGFNAIPTNLFPKPLSAAALNTFKFEVPFRSEDAGEEVWAGVYIDYGTSGTLLPNFDRRFEPSTFDDTSRMISFRIQGDLKEGCHTLTLFVTHLRNTLEDDVGELFLNEESARSERDLGVATWFLNVKPTGGEYTLPTCPAPATGP